MIFTFYYEAGCDPVAANQILKRDQVFIYFILEVMGKKSNKSKQRENNI